MLGCFINLGFDYDDVWHFIVCTIATAVILSIVDAIIFKLAFNITGRAKQLLMLHVEESKNVHWFFRALFILVIYIFSLNPVCKIVITPVVNISYDIVEEKYKNAESNIIKKLDNIIMRN